VVELLSDHSRCRVILVTLPEEMPVSETVEAAYQLEDRVGVQLGPVVVNGCDEAPGDLGVPAARAVAQAGATLAATRWTPRGGPGVPAEPTRAPGRADRAAGP